MNCTFRHLSTEPTGKHRYRCVSCGRETAPTASPADRVFAKCRRKSRGLGDWVAWLLGLIGITKRRAQAVARAVGRQSCGCGERQEKLNELGDKLTGG
jgi:hypothetical protein